MLKAKNQLEEIKFAWQIERLGDLIENLYCLHCNESVCFVDATLKVKHFRHYPYSKCLYRLIDNKKETIRHLQMKEYFIKKFNILPQNVEKVLTDCGRIADIFVLPNIVIELQASNITRKSFIKRTLAYTAKGYSVLWIFDSALELNPLLEELVRQLYFRRKYLMIANELAVFYENSDCLLSGSDFYLKLRTATPMLLGCIPIRVAIFNDKK